MYFSRLEDLRIDADKTQEEIAGVLNCQREVYRRYEKGTNEIPVWALIKLSEYYNVTTDYILVLSDSSKEKATTVSGCFFFIFLPSNAQLNTQ